LRRRPDSRPRRRHPLRPPHRLLGWCPHRDLPPSCPRRVPRASPRRHAHRTLCRFSRHNSRHHSRHNNRRRPTRRRPPRPCMRMPAARSTMLARAPMAEDVRARAAHHPPIDSSSHTGMNGTRNSSSHRHRSNSSSSRGLIMIRSCIRLDPLLRHAAALSHLPFPPLCLRIALRRHRRRVAPYRILRQRPPQVQRLQWRRRWISLRQLRRLLRLYSARLFSLCHLLLMERLPLDRPLHR
jgi:hypothetical protein